MEKVIVTTPSELEIMFKRWMREELAEHQAQQTATEPEEVITPDQLREMFDISRVTENDWRRKGLLPFFRMNRRIYYKKSEVLAAMVKAGKRRGGVHNG